MNHIDKKKTVATDSPVVLRLEQARQAFRLLAVTALPEPDSQRPIDVQYRSILTAQ